MADQNYDEINKLLHQYKAGNDSALYELYEFYKPIFILDFLSMAEHSKSLTRPKILVAITSNTLLPQG